MALQWTPYHLPLAVSIALAVAVAALAWRRRDRPGAGPLTVFVLAAGGWTLAELGSLSVTGVQAKALWLTVELTFSAVVPAAWALIALEYAGESNRSGRKWLAALSVEPIAFVAVAWTARDMVFSDPARRLTDGGYYIGTETLHAVFLAHAAYSYLLVLAATGLVVLAAVRERELLAQGLTMGVAMTLLLVANAAWLLDLTPPGLDPTNLAFVGSGLLLAVGIYRQRVLDVMPAMRSMARRQVFEGLPDAVVAVNSSGTVVDVNPATEHLFAVTRTDVTGRQLADAFPALVDPGDELVRERGGETRYYDVRESTPDESGWRGGRLITLRDVTDRHRTEQRYRTLIAESLDLVTVLDPDGTISYESPSVRTVLGYDPDERVGQSATDYIHPEDRARVVETLAATDPGDDEQVEFRIRAADGTWRWLEARGRNLVEDPIVGGVVVNSRDVTDRKHREQQLNVLYRVLRHNLRNEMTVVLANAEGIASRTEEAQIAHAAEKITTASERLVDFAAAARTAETILDQSDDTRTVALDDVVERTLEAARDRHSHADLSLDAPASPSVNAHSSLDVALAELLDNAVEHGVVDAESVGEATPDAEGDAPSVRVTVERDDTTGYVVVADDGPGIPREELDVFSSGEETPLHHSSGVGLWMVNWIVDLSGGELAFAREGSGDPLGDEADYDADWLGGDTQVSLPSYAFDPGTIVAVSLPLVDGSE